MGLHLPKIGDHYNNLLSNRYARLMRLDKPIGIYLSVLPALWAVALAGKSWGSIFIYSLIMMIGGVAARSAGCIINDILDRKIDSQVERTKLRPLASGELTIKQACITLGICAVLSLFALFLLTKLSIIFGLITIPLVMIYPLLKRFTFYPQIFLGSVFNMGVFIGWFAILPHFSYSAVTLYIACAMWTIGYDTIYGHQDIDDDILIGNKSLSIKVGEHTPNFVWALYQIMLVLLLLTGLSSSMNVFFYVICLPISYLLYWQSVSVDIKNPSDCATKFKSNAYIGLILWVAILVGKF